LCAPTPTITRGGALIACGDALIACGDAFIACGDALIACGDALIACGDALIDRVAVEDSCTTASGYSLSRSAFGLRQAM
jgi:hypothetical protein